MVGGRTLSIERHLVTSKQLRRLNENLHGWLLTWTMAGLKVALSVFPPPPWTLATLARPPLPSQQIPVTPNKNRFKLGKIASRKFSNENVDGKGCWLAYRRRHRTPRHDRPPAGRHCVDSSHVINRNEGLSLPCIPFPAVSIFLHIFFPQISQLGLNSIVFLKSTES